MINVKEYRPIEHVIGLVAVIIVHILVIWLLAIAMRHPKSVEKENPPLQVQIIEVSSAASAAAAQAVQPPAPEMIIPPPPDIAPPPINTEAPAQPPPPPVVKKRAKKQPPVTPPSHRVASQERAHTPSNSSGTIGQGVSGAQGEGKPDRSAGSRPINGAQIAYPPEMEEAGKTGRVILSCDVEASGNTSNCKVIEATNGSFKAEALKYASRARYSPATRNGLPVKEYGHRYTINFKLDAE